MNSENILLNDWHPVATAASLEENALISVVLLDQPLVIWRAGETLCAWHDSCVHRGTKLSLGKVVDGDCVQCPYHGWIYNSHGRCVHIPAMPDHKPSKRAQLKTYSVQEKYGWIWVCLGQPKNDVAEFPEWIRQSFANCSAGRIKLIPAGLGHRKLFRCLSLSLCPRKYPRHTGRDGDRRLQSHYRAQRGQGFQRTGLSTRPLRDWSGRYCCVYLPGTAAANRLPAQRVGRSAVFNTARGNAPYRNRVHCLHVDDHELRPRYSRKRTG